ncbi:MAG: toxin-antitoxin system, toxin component, PIN family protein [Spirochaetes bacterium RIFOXYC1_FULL_54_7]|nr:MAG: toxin-antitoxin system, toxin component, PIN family protein [Spirochaetes bacterium RIFOXYC1_FULL_54_7]
MKLLLDSCVWRGNRQTLADNGHDVSWVGDWESDPGDEEVLRRAEAEKRILVTLDKDFGELAIVHSQPHAGIIRLVGIPARLQATTCQAVTEKYKTELQQNAIITVTDTRVRIRLDPEN